MWLMVILTSHAETTTDNLLNNNSFTTDTSGWELSDNNENKVKRDPNTYSDSSSKSVRFRYQGGSISQDVDISNVPDNHIIKEIQMGYQSIGCGNTGSQWCNAGADDTVTSTITLSSTDTAEVISNVTAVPYENGWSDYSFTEEVLGSFNTNDLSVNLNIAGDDTGNSSNWYGPIVDNINLTFTIEEYIEPVTVIETVAVIETEEPIVMVGGLDLDISITNDIILDTPVIEPVSLQQTIIPIPDMIDIPQAVDIGPEQITDLPEINNIDVIQEIPELDIDVEPELEVAIVEIPEELKEINMEEDIKEMNNDNTETEVSEKSEPQSEEEGKADEGTDGESELSEQTTDSERADSSDDSKVVKKSKSKDKKTSKKDGTKKTASEKKKSSGNSKSVSKEKNTKSASTIRFIEQIVLPSAYLQVMQNSITITENISLVQEMIYEQDLSAYTSNDAWDSLNSAAESRWNSVLGVQSSHSFRGYRK